MKRYLSPSQINISNIVKCQEHIIITYLIQLFNQMSIFVAKHVNYQWNFYRKHLLLTLIIIKITETPSEWVSGSVSWSVLVCAVSRDTEPRKMGH